MNYLAKIFLAALFPPAIVFVLALKSQDWSFTEMSAQIMENDALWASAFSYAALAVVSGLLFYLFTHRGHHTKPNPQSSTVDSVASASDVR